MSKTVIGGKWQKSKGTRTMTDSNVNKAVESQRDGDFSFACHSFRGNKKMEHDDGLSYTIVDGSMAEVIIPYRDLEDAYANEGPSDMEEALRLDVEDIEKELNSRDMVVDDGSDITNGNIVDHVFVDEPSENGDGGENLFVDDPTEHFDNPVEHNEELCIGKYFANANAAYEFYNNYARNMGFSVRKSKVERSRKRKEGMDVDGDVLSRMYVCSREGFKDCKDKRQEGKDVTRRADSRVGCPARLRVKSSEGGLVVDQFISAHNHSLVEPAEIYRLRSHQWLSDLVVQIANTLDDCGIGMATIYEVVKSMSGGASKVGLPELAFKNFMKRQNQKFLGMDLKKLIEYLHHSKLCDPQFFCKMATTDDGTVRGIFWVDGTARAAYHVFGDVVVFDTTYKKNRYHFPFGPFTGVNHHGQSILFGCGLVADETIESFIWLFSTWLKAMGDRPPVAIITDQCPSLLRAIPHVFPRAKHRYCSWHVQKHCMEHLSHLYGTSQSFKQDFGRCIYGSKTEIEFETRWQELLVNYNLVEHAWLKKMYEQRVHWVPLYLRGTFFAGMSSTQRSEGMNYYFRGYFKQSIPLYKFARQYERAVERRREREASSNFACINTNPPLLVGSPLEVHASKVYTRKIFEIFKKHWSAALGLTASLMEVHGQKQKYLVGPFDVPEEYKCEVWYDLDAGVVTCSCKLFEFMGLLCKHILRVFHKTDLKEIPSQYLLKRWTKDARHYLSSHKEVSDGGFGSVTSMWAFQDAVRRLIATISGSQEACDSATVALGIVNQKILQAMGESNSQTFGVDPQPSANATHDLYRNLHIPMDVVTKGRPNESRSKHPMEMTSGRKNRCGNCKELGHNKSTCKKVVSASANDFNGQCNEE
ncbi:protein FAR1-RELATED SEQUENCE 5-like [Telopea speciosissima]|uniref:protein FAR1-RELATED SEQUENCE 5-like n=1 Tax=Telopea speciosissima TaxID=54955 RepID=UPI001CC3CF94|nr:protein FAR1-RELATED SEQUENCE 5-like [Telopea speciosissima]